MSTTFYVCEAFKKLCDLCIALGASPANKHKACWEHRVDERWEIAFNGHNDPKMCSHGVVVDPYNCYVQYNGWPAGVFTPYGGCIAAGEGANETTFLAALTRAEAEALGCRLPDADDPEGYSITIGLR